MDEFYTVDEAAQRLGIAKQTITRYMRQGLIKGFRIGGRGSWRLDRASFDAFCKGESESDAK